MYFIVYTMCSVYYEEVITRKKLNLPLTFALNIVASILNFSPPSLQPKKSPYENCSCNENIDNSTRPYLRTDLKTALLCTYRYTYSSKVQCLAPVMWIRIRTDLHYGRSPGSESRR